MLKRGDVDPGQTTEVAVVLTYLVGALTVYGQREVAIVVGASTAMLLHLRSTPQGMGRTTQRPRRPRDHAVRRDLARRPAGAPESHLRPVRRAQPAPDLVDGRADRRDQPRRLRHVPTDGRARWHASRGPPGRRGLQHRDDDELRQAHQDERGRDARGDCRRVDRVGGRVRSHAHRDRHRRPRLPADRGRTRGGHVARVPHHRGGDLEVRDDGAREPARARRTRRSSARRSSSERSTRRSSSRLPRPSACWEAPGSLPPRPCPGSPTSTRSRSRRRAWSRRTSSEPTPDGASSCSPACPTWSSSWVSWSSSVAVRCSSGSPACSRSRSRSAIALLFAWA